MAEKYVERIKSASSGEVYTIRDANAALASDLTTHTNNSDIHVTAAKKSEWDAKQDALPDTAGKEGKYLKVNNDGNLAWAEGGGSGGTSDYDDLDNKPAIDNHELNKNSTAVELGLATSNDLAGKQDTLIGEGDNQNIKSINGSSILGSGNIECLTSSTIDVITDNNYSDIIIEDDKGNALVQFAEGHIKTKNFDSKNIAIPNLPPFLDLTGKTVGFLGDSITAGSGASITANRYSTLFCSIAKCTERNMGIGGTCLCANTKNGRTSERFLTRVTSANINGLNLLFIFGGTNDFSYDIKAVGPHFEEETISGTTYRGTKKRVPNSDNETFSGALHELILAIRAINPALPIVYLTPISRGLYNTTDPRPTSYETNANGNYLSDYVDAMKDICAFYNIPVFHTMDHFPYDLAQDAKNAIVTGYSTDAIHPNDKGHAILAQTLYKWTITNISI